MVRYPKIVLTGHFKMIWNEKRAFRTPPDATWPCGHLVELSVWRLIRSNHAQPGRFYAKPHRNLAQYICATRINAGFAHTGPLSCGAEAVPKCCNLSGLRTT